MVMTMADDYSLPYGISKAYTDVPIHDCYVNLEIDPRKPARYVYGRVYPAFPYRLTKGSVEDGDLAIDPGDRTNNDPLQVWELLKSLKIVPANIAAKFPRGK